MDNLGLGYDGLSPGLGLEQSAVHPVRRRLLPLNPNPFASPCAPLTPSSPSCAPPPPSSPSCAPSPPARHLFPHPVIPHRIRAQAPLLAPRAGRWIPPRRGHPLRAGRRIPPRRVNPPASRTSDPTLPTPTSAGATLVPDPPPPAFMDATLVIHFLTIVQATDLGFSAAGWTTAFSCKFMPSFSITCIGIFAEEEFELVFKI